MANKTTPMMQSLLDKIRYEPRRSIIFLISLIVFRAGIQFSLYRQGFISVAADEFSRGIRAAMWAADPQFDILFDVQGTWLPFEKYLNGLILLVWPDVILVPRVSVFIASCLLLIAFYLLAYYLFDNFVIAAMSSLFVMLMPWYVWLSGTPMLEMYYLAFFFAGLLFLIVWLKEARKGFWIGAGLCFLVASGFHVQSWTLINIVNLLTLPFLFRFIRRKEFSELVRLVAYYFISNGLIISFTAIEYASTGEAFAFLENHTSYSKWFYGGYDLPISEKLLYYPRIIYRQANIIIWFYLALAVGFLVLEKDRYLKLFPLLLSAASLLLNSTMNVYSGPPSAAPDRYSLFHVMVLALYLSYGTYQMFRWGRNRSQQFVRYSVAFVSVLSFLFALYWGANQIRDYPVGMTRDPVEIGTHLNTLLNDIPGTYMVELHYWDFLAVNLTSLHFDEIVFDREQDLRNRNTESVFLQRPEDICEVIISSDIRYVALTTEELKQKATQINILIPRQNAGAWTIFEVVPESGDGGCDTVQERG
jgi:hypothetical protein